MPSVFHNLGSHSSPFFNHTHDPSYDFRCLFSRLETWTISGCICLFTWDAFMVMTKERALNPYCYSETSPNLRNIVEIPSQEADPATLSVLFWMVHIPWDKKPVAKTSLSFLIKTKNSEKTDDQKFPNFQIQARKQNMETRNPKEKEKESPAASEVTICDQFPTVGHVPVPRERKMLKFCCQLPCSIGLSRSWCFKINSTTSYFFFMSFFLEPWYLPVNAVFVGFFHRRRVKFLQISLPSAADGHF